MTTTPTIWPYISTDTKKVIEEKMKDLKKEKCDIKTCVCDINVLIREGCQCGAMS
jgi:hypothetical protein